MTKKEWLHLHEIPADIERRKRRIEMLERRQADGPDCVTDTVLSSTDAGDATVLCHATIRGKDARFDDIERQIAELRENLIEIDAKYWKEYAEACREIETEPDPETRGIVNDVVLYGKSYADVEREKYGETGIDAVKKRVYRWIEKHSEE